MQNDQPASQPAETHLASPAPYLAYFRILSKYCNLKIALIKRAGLFP